MPSSHLILCHPLLFLPPIPPSIRVFSNDSTLCMRWPKYRSFSFSTIPSEKCTSKLQWGITSHPSEWQLLKKSTNNKCCGGYGEKRVFLHYWWECKLIQPLRRMVWQFLKKLKNRTTIWSTYLTPEHMPWDIFSLGICFLSYLMGRLDMNFCKIHKN